MKITSTSICVVLAICLSVFALSLQLKNNTFVVIESNSENLDEITAKLEILTEREINLDELKETNIIIHYKTCGVLFISFVLCFLPKILSGVYYSKNENIINALLHVYGFLVMCLYLYTLYCTV